MTIIDQAAVPVAGRSASVSKNVTLPSFLFRRGTLLTLAAPLAGMIVPALPSAHAGLADYRFELVGTPAIAGGKNVLHVRLVHLPDGKPVPNAIVIQANSDMGPAGMETMTAPAAAVPGDKDGIYAFEVQPTMSGKWALRLKAKVQGEAETVQGTVTADLVK